MWVMVLLAYDRPIQAIVKAFGVDERTVSDWQARAGQHCQQVHEHLVENSQHDLEQVQADEIKVKKQKGTIWMALAIWVPTRLWMGGVISPKRDLDLIQALADKVRKMALFARFCWQWMDWSVMSVRFEMLFAASSLDKKEKQAGAKWFPGKTSSLCKLSNNE